MEEKTTEQLNAEYIFGMSVPQVLGGVELNDKTIKIFDIYRKHGVPFLTAVDIILELFALDKEETHD